MKQIKYHYDMRMLILGLFTVLFGCTHASDPIQEKPVNKAPSTHPAPYRKPKRMVCGTKVAVVAVIDTGFNYVENSKICKFAHKDFTSLKETKIVQGIETPVPTDNHGHGTNVVGLIQKYAGDANYCILVLKYYDPKSVKDDNLKNSVRAIRYATSLGVKYINYSGGGTEFSYEENRAVKEFLDKGGTLIAAAGNERSNIDKFRYYPAMDDPRVISVGSMDKNGNIASYSNFGKSVVRWENGTNQTAFGIMMSGTSQATAIATGKIIKEQECDK